MALPSRTNKVGGSAHRKKRFPTPETEYQEYAEIAAQFPPKFQPFFRPNRYKIVYGGRGSSKSWSVARALLLMGSQKPLRIVCARELQQSILDSSHRTLCDQIYNLGLQDFYEIEKNSIRGKAPDPDKPTVFTEFRFMGLKSNPHQIKSYEGIDIIWIAEAQNVSDYSWRTILPTIRRADSEIWIDFNPEHEKDATFKRWVLDPPDDALVIKMNYYDNPWFPDVLRKEMERDKAKDYTLYRHIWEGETVSYFEGAVYLNELKECENENRVSQVLYDPLYPVEAFFDIGYGDSTAIWFAQKVGTRIHVLEAHEGVGKHSDYWVKYISDSRFPVAKIWLPHDARQHHGSLSWEEQFRMKFHGRVQIVKNVGLMNGINAARLQFPTMYFDITRTSDGINALRHYRFEVTEDGKGLPKSKPVHDKYSNFADSFRYMCVALRPEKEKITQEDYSGYQRDYSHGHANNSWMGL